MIRRQIFNQANQIGLYGVEEGKVHGPLIQATYRVYSFFCSSVLSDVFVPLIFSSGGDDYFSSRRQAWVT